MSDGSYDKNTQQIGTSRNNDIKQVAHSQRENGVLCRVPDKIFNDSCVQNRFWPLASEEYSEIQHEGTTGLTHDNTSVLSTSHASAAEHHSPVEKNAVTKMCRTQPHRVSHVRPAVEKTALQAEDKYDLELRFRARHRQAISEAASVHTFKEWNSQNDDKYGFIPLSDMIMPKQIESNKYSTYFEAHRQVRESKQFNYMKTQIVIPSELNPDVWDSHLTQYWDKQLTLLIRYGFPLDFNVNSVLSHEETNHKSAKDFKNDVKAYLKEETELGAILGPFDTPPLNNLHISPFMTRPKPKAVHRRVIIDLSLPANASVNAGVSSDSYLGTKFLLTLPTIDEVTKKVRQFGKGSLLFKIDISRAFRHIKIDPIDYNLLGLKLDKYFIDRSLPFGYRQGSAIFQRVTDAIRFIMSQAGHSITNYIDDLVGYGTPSMAQKSYDHLYHLLQELGFKISEKKLVPPSTKCICLGIEIDTVEFTLSIPPDKLIEITDTCKYWETKHSCSKKELQSLLGKLLYISKCVRSSRFFLNRMLHLLRTTDKSQMISLTPEFKRDLNWFCQFTKVFNGTAFFHHTHHHGRIELDASLQGLGANFNNEVYAIPIVKNYNHFGIVHLEMLNIMVAIRVWAQQWAGKTIIIACDNEAVVSVLNSGRTRDMILAAISRNIAMESAMADINLRVIHIPGKQNVIADSLSRYHTADHHRKHVYDILPNASFLFPDPAVLNINWSI